MARVQSLVYEAAWAHYIRRITAAPVSNPASAEIARTFLLLIACSQQELTVPTVQRALAVFTGSIDDVEENVLELDDMISACGGLVSAETSKKNSTARLALIHHTLREYLNLTQDTWFPDAHGLLAATCLETLLSDASPTGPCTSEGGLEERLKSDAFYDCAARSWEYHLRKAGVTDCADSVAPAAAQARKLALSLLQHKMRRAAAEKRLLQLPKKHPATTTMNYLAKSQACILRRRSALRNPWQDT
jgi:hypothetical protein